VSPGGAVPRVLECEGAPRDLGLDQGMAVRDELRRYAASLGLELPSDEEVSSGGLGLASLERLASGLGAALRARRRESGRDRGRPGAASRIGRDLARHFPQLAERCEGLARGGRVPAAALLAACVDELGRDAGDGALLELPGRATPLLVRALPAAPLLWRRSRPENGLRSLELVSAAGLGAVAGVNEAGLAIAWAARGARLAPAFAARCAAPATLLVQECLQRFESVPGAAAWCSDRPGLGGDPAGEGIELVLADAAGDVAGVRRGGDGFAATFTPRRLTPTAGALGGEDARGAVAIDPPGRRARLASSLSTLAREADAGSGWLGVVSPEA